MNQQLMLLLQMQDIDKEVIALEKEKKKLPIRKQLSEVISEVTQLKEKYTKTEEFVTKAEAACDTLKMTYQQYDKKIAGNGFSDHALGNAVHFRRFSGISFFKRKEYARAKCGQFGCRAEMVERIQRGARPFQSRNRSLAERKKRKIAQNGCGGI